MSQTPQWGPQGGYPPQGQPAPGGYPPQGQPAPGGYPPQQQPGFQPQPGYNPQGGYNPQAGYAPQAGYPPQGAPGGYPPQQAGAGGLPPQGAPPGKKSPAMLIGIVVAAVVLLAAIGGIILVLNKSDKTQPGSTITPAQPTTQPTEQPTGQSTTQPTDQPTDQSTGQGTGQAIDLGNGISLTPAPGYQVEKSQPGFALLTTKQSIFVGQVVKGDASTNPGQACDNYHHNVATKNNEGNPQYSQPKTVNINPKVKAATCQLVSTLSDGNGSTDVVTFTLVSVRTDGLTVMATTRFQKGADVNQLDKDFSAMANSMLKGQLAGG
jgi:hypothetical protein